jgi:hypothetical protein
MARNENWVMVRVRKDVHIRLQAMQDSLIRQQAKLAEAGSPWLDGDISISDVIKTLLFREDEKNQRAAASRQRRQRAKDMVGSEAP